MRPFEEEEAREGTGIVSDAFKVEGEDPATPGEHLRSVDTSTPQDRNGTVTIPQYRVNKTKKHTHQEALLCGAKAQGRILAG